MTGKPGFEGNSAIAVFDFDGTLTYCDTLLPFLRYASGRASFWWRLLTLLPVLLAFRLRVLDRTRTKEAVLRRYIGGWTEERVRSVAAAFATGPLPRLLNPRALERVQWHSQQGHRVVIASACLDIYVARWAAAPPMQMEAGDVLATRLEVMGGRVTGRLDGANCHGPEKLARLRERMGSLDGTELYAYGDSAGDRELLEAAAHPFYKPFREDEHRWKGVFVFLKALL